MNSVAQEMMALLKNKAPPPREEEPDDKNYTSGMHPEMFDQSDMLTNYDEPIDNDEYFEELDEYEEEDPKLPDDMVKRPTTDSEKLKRLEEQLLSSGCESSENLVPEKVSKLEI
jgi:hypothetical protein